MSPLTPRFYRNRGGFALIITIVLVAFLVLILVGLATFTRVETQVADNTAGVAKARQNAMEGLNVAIGQLQRYAGRDKATTARGDLFGFNDKRKNLISIWNDDSGWGQRAWLVSGSEPNESLAATLAKVEDPTGTEDDTNVFLVSNKSVEVDVDRVLVKRQPLETEASNIPGLTGNALTKIGHYAYWVGDEGAKASLNIVDPTLLAVAQPSYNGGAMSNWSDLPTRARLNQQMLPQPQISNIRTELSTINLTNAATVAQLAQIYSNQSLSYVTGFPAANQSQLTRELFYDVTPRAEAVLADLRTGDGRLKVDLSDNTKGSAAIRDYVSLPLSASVPSANYTTTHDVSKSSFPVITEGSVRLSFYRSGGQLHVAYQLDVEMWNPYASTLRYSEDGNGTKVGTETDVITIEVAGLPTVDLATDGTPPTTVNGLDLDATLDGATFTNANVSGNFQWAPGQFKVLSTAGADMLVETLSPAPRVSGWNQPIADTVNTSQITVMYPIIANTLEFRLKIGTTVVSTYKPQQNFSGGNTITTASTPTEFSLGYGVQFVNNLKVFAKDEDPRQSNLPNACFEQTTWESDPKLNATKTFDSGDDFNYDAGTQKQWVLFDLRRQEVISVGQLRHLINNTPYQGANALYDVDFFSTTPAAPWTVANIATQPLPNRYLRLINPLRGAAATEAQLRDGDISARYLLQTAAFNINSTSIPAWKALLGAKINGWVYDPAGASTKNLSHAFFRLGHGGQTLTKAPLVRTDLGAGTADEDVLYTAGRDLDDTEVTRLAEKIVARSQAWAAANNRPFESIQDFINSNVVRDALSDVSSAPLNLINKGLPTERDGTPGELTQEDVIAAIAPMITPRSDTFKIRAYGDVYNSVTGAVTARAWCEAIVQRMPDIAEDLTLPADGGVAGHNVNDPDFGTYPFGRKFIIVSFRWLTSGDI